MAVHLDLELPQIKQLIDQLAQQDKAELARYLDGQTFFEEFKRFTDSKSGIDLIDEQITAEVRAVKQLRA